MLKNTFLFIFSEPEIVFSFCFLCSLRSLDFVLTLWSIFSKDYRNTSRRYGANSTGKNVLLTFQMEQNETF